MRKSRSSFKKPLKKNPRKADAYHHGDLKQGLLKAALRHLEASGPETLSLRELAQELGVSQAAPYRHFKDRDALIAAISQEGFEIKYQKMREAMLATMDRPVEMFHACARAYLDMALEHPQHFRLMMSGTVCPDEDRPDLMIAACRSFVLLKIMIQRCQRAGVIAAGDPNHRALQCWALVHGFASLYSAGRLEWTGIHRENAAAAFDLMIEQVRAGIGNAPLPSKLEFVPFVEGESAKRVQLMEVLEQQLLGETPEFR
ncbi:MAG: TetR/AcrR family transcriptional regulator [Bdellovibrionales bacterium]|nr:TetR/AcrR family transcriptional regulator [Bdellovibrionales bacterium]